MIGNNGWNLFLPPWKYSKALEFESDKILGPETNLEVSAEGELPMSAHWITRQRRLLLYTCISMCCDPNNMDKLK